MKHYFFLFLLIFLSASWLSGQNYTRDGGIHLGQGVFFSYRQFYDEETAVETMIGYTNRGIRAVALREYLQTFSSVRSESLRLVFGYGIHAGLSYTNRFTFLFRDYYHDWEWTPQIGLDGMAGLEFALSEYPLVMRVCAHPYFEYSLNRFFELNVFNIIVSVNYRF